MRPRPIQHPLGAFGALVSLPYGLVVRARHALYDGGLLPAHHAPMPVVNVGGLEAGGTGKTPMVAVVLARLQRAGLVPGLLTRGYRRAARGLEVRAVGTPVRVGAVGDEAAMLVAQGLDVAIAACASRTTGAAALAALGCNAAVMDDGLSHRALARALNIVMLRAEQPLDEARLLPWGSLREPIAALRRADLVVVHHRGGRAPKSLPEAMRRMLADYLPAHAVLMSEQAPAAILDAAGVDRTNEVPGLPVLVAAGTARPPEVAAAATALGADVRAFYGFADHHAFGPATQDLLRRACRTHGAQALIVTAKDAVKLPPVLGATPLWTLHRPLQLLDPNDALGAALSQAFGGQTFAPTTQHIVGGADTLL